MPLCDISPPPYITSNPQLSTTPVQCQSKWKAGRMCRSNNVLLYGFLTAEKIPPTTIHRHMLAVYGNKSVYVSIGRHWVWQIKLEEVEDTNLCDKELLGEVSDCNRWVSPRDADEMIQKIVESNRKTLLLNWESLKKDWATWSTSLDSEKFVPGGYHKN